MTIDTCEFRHIEVSKHAKGVISVVLNRPGSLNALNERLCAELTSVFRQSLTDLEDGTSAIVLSGAGRAFCAGADLKERRQLSPTEWMTHHRYFEDLADAMIATSVPVIAAVNGLAIGGGCELALLSDIVVAAASSWFQFPETALGIIPGMGGTQLLVKRIGYQRATEMILGGAKVDAATALGWGLISSVVQDDMCWTSAMELASAIAVRDTAATRAAKSALRVADGCLTAGLSEERRLYASVVLRGATEGGVRRFWEGRSKSPEQ